MLIGQPGLAGPCRFVLTTMPTNPLIILQPFEVNQTKGVKKQENPCKTFTKNILLPQTLTAQNAGPVKMIRLARVPSQLDITGEDRDEEKHHLKQTWSRNESSNRLPGFHKFSNKKSGFDSLKSRVGTSSAIETSFGQHWSHPIVHSP